MFTFLPHCCSNLSTIMYEWKLWVALLLHLGLCLDTEEATMKTIGSEPDVTPLCTRAALHIITLIVCKIRTERKWEECRLLYQHGNDFVNECDSRFTLMTENHTVFLHLTSLTPADSGNYTCECSYAGGTDYQHLIITVKGEETDTPHMKMLIYTSVISSCTSFIVVTGVVLGLVLRRKCCRDDATSEPPGLSACETSYSLDEDDPDDPYTSLHRPTTDLYHTISSMHHQRDTKTHSGSSNVSAVHLEQEKDEREDDQNSAIYEII